MRVIGAAMLIKTQYGTVEGFHQEGVMHYLGIPFARPPIGELAFRHPQEPEPWEGVLETTAGRANPMQSRSYFPSVWFSQDCLYLNIFVPDNRSENTPVMVWFYGGAFENGGTGANEEDSPYVSYDLSEFARETKTICVTFNYRLNLYGFLNLSSFDSGFDVNNGIMDQLMALRFVKNNIAAFGGDPENITIFGQSAGAASVLTILTMKQAKGLFHKAILQSPVADHFFSEAESRKYAKRYLNYAGVKEPEELRSMNVETYERANRKYSTSFLVHRDIRCAFSPIIDGTIIADYPRNLLDNNPVPVLIGHTTEEGNIFTPNLPSLLYGPATAHMKMKGDKTETNRKKRMSDAITRSVFVEPIDDIVSHYPGSIWKYVYAHTVPGDEKGACHCSELSVLFNDASLIGNPEHPESQRVGKNMRRIWGQFAHQGNCDWEPKTTYTII